MGDRGSETTESMEDDAVSKKIKQKKKPIRGGHTKPALVETPSVPVLRLDLGCGQNPKEGFEGVDLYGDKAKHMRHGISKLSDKK